MKVYSCCVVNADYAVRNMFPVPFYVYPDAFLFSMQPLIIYYVYIIPIILLAYGVKECVQVVIMPAIKEATVY